MACANIFAPIAGANLNICSTDLELSFASSDSCSSDDGDLMRLTTAAGLSHRHVSIASQSNMHMHTYNRWDYEQSDSNESDLHDDEFELHDLNAELDDEASIPWAI